MGKWTGKACRLIAMLSLTFSFFLVELIVGYTTNSLALVADSFHMLSDVVALIVGLLSVTYAKKGSSKSNTFGWARAEVLGANVNAVFLVALCFTILVEAIQRMVELEPITNSKLLLIVGGVGLGINLIGLALFHNQAHGHSHGGGGHGHSHGGGHSHGRKAKGHGHSHNGNSNSHERKPLQEAESRPEIENEDSDEDGADAEISIDVKQMDGTIKNVILTKDPKQRSAEQLNMKGVFLHVLGDALGSVVVMISAIIYMATERCERRDFESGGERGSDMFPRTTTTALTSTLSNSLNISTISTLINITTEAPECFKTAPQWINFVDPVLSIFLVAIILSTSIPLVKDSGMILMQTVPTHIVVSTMQAHLEKMDGIMAVHEFHVWSLAGDKIVASLHIHLRTLEDYIRVSNQVKEYFHDEGIHSVTIQPEFVDLHVKKAGRECVLECGPEKDCHPATCCSVNQKTLDVVATGSQAKTMDNDEIRLQDVTVIPNAITANSAHA